MEHRDRCTSQQPRPFSPSNPPHSGKDERLRRADFRTFASTAGLRISDADAAIDETIARVKAAVDAVALPTLLTVGPGEKIVSAMLDLCRMKIASIQ